MVQTDLSNVGIQSLISLQISKSNNQGNIRVDIFLSLLVVSLDFYITNIYKVEGKDLMAGQNKDIIKRAGLRTVAHQTAFHCFFFCYFHFFDVSRRGCRGTGQR